MSPVWTLVLACAAVVVASILAGWLPLLIKLTHRRMELALSFIAGAMLGVGMIILLPHAFMEQAAWLGEAGEVSHELLNPVIGWVLAGFLAMFFIQRFFRFHHHELPQGETGAAAACDHHEHAHDHGHQHDHRHRLTWSGAAIGLTLHSLIDGIALAASVTADAQAGHATIPGLATCIVILLHKPFDSISLGTLLAAGGHSQAMRHVVNLLYSLVLPVGVLLFVLGLGEAGPATHWWVSIALAFSAGTFLCISLSDLLPELQFHQHDRWQLSLALLAGIALAWVISWSDPHHHGHDHDHGQTHEHHDHDH